MAVILADREMVRKGENSLILKLGFAEGIPVRLETRYGNAHNKVLLIDAGGEQASSLPAANFTWSAQARNAENLLILRGNPRWRNAVLTTGAAIATTPRR
ncbi:MAG: hypothetical protein IPL72_05385 [Sulfuritalea sp.]|nr:hypothetical protein [Sulfuritalea sp.]